MEYNLCQWRQQSISRRSGENTTASGSFSISFKNIYVIFTQDNATTNYIGAFINSIAIINTSNQNYSLRIGYSEPTNISILGIGL